MEHGGVLLARPVIVGAGSVVLHGVTPGLAASARTITLAARDA